MGRFKAEAVLIRKVDRLEIVFLNRETIYVSDGLNWHIFHRWFAPRGSYTGGWSQFRHALLYRKSLNITDCYRLASMAEIQSQIARKGPDLSNINTKEVI